jgi:hypothetical protein
MRKQIINDTEPNPPEISEEWLNLEEIARMEVSSEDPRYPIESAFKHTESLGWRAGQLGERTIRLLLMSPKIFADMAPFFWSQKLSERSSSPCVWQIAKQVLSSSLSSGSR